MTFTKDKNEDKDKDKDSQEIEVQKVYFNSRIKTATNKEEIGSLVDKNVEEIVMRVGVWLAEGSGWTTKSIDGHYINIVKWNPLSGSSYIELPKELQHS